MTEQERAANFKGMLAKLGTKFSKKIQNKGLQKCLSNEKKGLQNEQGQTQTPATHHHLTQGLNFNLPASYFASKLHQFLALQM
jgi:hypothetical protein